MHVIEVYIKKLLITKHEISFKWNDIYQIGTVSQEQVMLLRSVVEHVSSINFKLFIFSIIIKSTYIYI